MGFVIGLLCGGFVGISVMCLLIAAGKGENGEGNFKTI